MKKIPQKKEEKKPKTDLAILLKRKNEKQKAKFIMEHFFNLRYLCNQA